MPTMPESYIERTDNGVLGVRRLARLSCALCLFLPPLAHAGYAVGQEARPAARAPLGQVVQFGIFAPILMPGDLISLEVFDTPELSLPQLRIDQDGTIAVPVVGNVKVAGLSPLQANSAVEQRLRDAQIMTNPSVTILVIQYATGRGVDVIGEVRVPGIYTFLGPHSLFDALAAAGGVTPTQGATITVTHHGDPTHPVIVAVGGPDYIEARYSTLVESGDVVEVAHAENIYVVGDVVKSGQFPLINGKSITALQALALAAGPTKTSKLHHAGILRKTGTTFQMIPLDLRRVEKAEVADPVLLANDVLVIQRNEIKAFIDTALPGVTSGAVGAIIYSQLNR